ncbi:MAG: type II secretion system protein [Phycisphaerales bacterium]|nr:type II secretion system protein [Phycisphaerales bacterium]
MHERNDKQCGRAFTIIELMVVIAIIALLMSLMLVGVHGVRDRAKQAKTGQLLTSVKVAVIGYKREFGHLPPEVGPTGLGREDANERGRWDWDVDAEDWSNVVSPGSGFTVAKHLNGRNVVANYSGTDREVDGVSGPGMRRPSVSGGYFWTGATTSPPPTSGKVYQPFMEMRDESAFMQTGAIDWGSTSNQRAVMAVDAYGSPIRYYNFEDPGRWVDEPTREERLVSLINDDQIPDRMFGPVREPNDLINDPIRIPYEYRGIGFAIVADGPDELPGRWFDGAETDAETMNTLAADRMDNLVETGS